MKLGEKSVYINQCQVLSLNSTKGTVFKSSKLNLFILLNLFNLYSPVLLDLITKLEKVRFSLA